MHQIKFWPVAWWLVFATVPKFKLVKYLYSILLCLVTTFPVSAQSILQPGMNDLDIGEPLNLRFSSQDSVNSLIDYSWLLEDSWSLKCRYQTFSVEDFAVGSHNYQTRLSGFTSRHYIFGGGTTAAYLGIEAGWRRTKFGSVRESGFVFGSRLGIRYYFNNSVSIDSSISYKFSTDDVFIVNHNATDSYIYPGIGLKASF